MHIEWTDRMLTIGLEQGPADLSQPRVDANGLRRALGGRAPVRLHPALLPAAGSVGSNHLLVPLASRQDVDAAAPDGPALGRILDETGAQGCYVYSLEPGEDGHDAYCRFFNPTVGISEDPATGSAAGPLAAHMRRDELAGSHVRILQGRAMGRPSTLDIFVGRGGTRLTGRCALAATGELRL